MKKKPKNLVYKLLTREEMARARRTGRFDGAPIDLADGFIHFSTGVQVVETARRHFATIDPLILVALDAGAMGEELLWEPSRGGDLFPHLYGRLPMRSLIWWTVLDRADDGAAVFCDLVTGLGPLQVDAPPIRRLPARSWSETPVRLSDEATPVEVLHDLVDRGVGRVAAAVDLERARAVGLDYEGARLAIDEDGFGENGIGEDGSSEASARPGGD